MSNSWLNRPRPAMSGRHDPTAEQAMAFQILAAELRRRRAGAQWQPSALWRAMHCYGMTEADVRRAAR